MGHSYEPLATPPYEREAAKRRAQQMWEEQQRAKAAYNAAAQNQFVQDVLNQVNDPGVIEGEFTVVGESIAYCSREEGGGIQTQASIEDHSCNSDSQAAE